MPSCLGTSRTTIPEIPFYHTLDGSRSSGNSGSYKSWRSCLSLDISAISENEPVSPLVARFRMIIGAHQCSPLSSLFSFLALTKSVLKLEKGLWERWIRSFTRTQKCSMILPSLHSNKPAQRDLHFDSSQGLGPLDWSGNLSNYPAMLEVFMKLSLT